MKRRRVHSTLTIHHFLHHFLAFTTPVLLLCLGFLVSCSRASRSGRTTIEFWGLGREGEVVAELVPEFERRNPDIHIDVQQIPWTAAHEKLLTAHVGKSLPDISQMGNTWIPEFETIGALEDLGPFVARSKVVEPNDYFDGIWQTNMVGTTLYGVPWYVDTRVLFYRKDLLAAAGYDHPPKSWSEWREMLAALKKQKGRDDFYPILLPTNEWAAPVILAISQGAPLVGENGKALFRDPRFVSAFDYFLGFFRSGFAPRVNASQIANLYQQFGEGEFVMFLTGPWNVGELRRRLPESMQGKWATAPIPAPDGMPYPGLSIAGGSSLVIFQHSEKKEAAWKFIEFLSEPVQQAKFYEMSGDLPARKSAWQTPLLAGDDKIKAFREQLDHTVALPRIPEWEHIATAIFEQGEIAARGVYGADRAAELLDRRVDKMLTKRRWVLERMRQSGFPPGVSQ